MIQAHTYLPDVLSGGATGAAWTMQQHIYRTAHPASPFEVAWSSVERRAPVVHADDVTPAAPRCLPVGHAAGATQRVGSGAHHRRAQGAPALPPLHSATPANLGSKAMNSPHGKRRIRVGFAGMKGNKTENASLHGISKLDHTPYSHKTCTYMTVSEEWHT